MFFKIGINYIIGYIKIRVEGFYIERFMNLCQQENILLWHVKREKDSILWANISIADFKRIKHMTKVTSCKVKIEKKKGLPFLFHRYHKRKIFAGLLLVVIFLLILSSNYVWNIEINGNQAISQEDLMENLKKEGLTIGVNKKDVHTKEIIRAIRMERNDIAWMSIDLKGTNVIVKIVETKEKPELVDSNDYCNIVADHDGMISKISVSNGTAKVKPGDIVKEGDILVEGMVTWKYTDPIYVHAAADIEMKTWYSVKEKFPFYQQVEEKTGKTEKKYAIKIKDFQINLYKVLSKFENYDTINENKKLSLFHNFYLPIEIMEQENLEKIYYEVKYTKEELKNKSIHTLEAKIKEQIPENAKVLSKYVNYKADEEGLEMELVYEIAEHVETKEKINI